MSKVLPLYQRFLYWLWFGSNVALIILPAIAFTLLRYYLIERLYIHDLAISFMSGGGVDIVFAVGSFMVGIPILVGYSYLTNRGIIQKADKLYQLGSFQEYPKRANIFICAVLLAIGLPIFILSFNSYSYITPEKIGIKSTFSIDEKTYEYSDIIYMEKKIYSNGAFKYKAHFKDNKTKAIFEDKTVEEAFIGILEKNNIDVKTTIYKPLFE